MQSRAKKFYITTAIDYVNSAPHIGTAYEKIGADVLARWHRLCDFDVHFQMGNDEHSINVQRAAEKEGLDPKAYCDRMRVIFEATWKKLDISYDGFIQTSDPHHEKGVQELFRRILDAGDIYKAPYEGWYCESCEAFYTEKDLLDGVCPNHKTKPKWLKEENHFFALKKYCAPLLKHVEEYPEFIQPENRRNEILSLLREGLEDVSVSRSSFHWGIPLPHDPKHVVYVWFDALINYITAIGFHWDEKQFQKWWPADVHVIGKDITRFHCVIWPAMLMSARLPLPKTVFGHGFISFKGEKMSKSLGNIVAPLDVVDHYGADALRFYLLREGSFGRDGDFTWENFISRYNGDLANGLGNLVSRTLGMVEKYQAGLLEPLPSEMKTAFVPLHQKADPLFSILHQFLSPHKGDISFHSALAALWEAMAEGDRTINEVKPWELAKQEKTEEISELLSSVAELIRIIAILLFPFLPTTANRIWKAFGFDTFGTLESQRVKDASWGGLTKKVATQSVALFPRIEKETTKGKPMNDLIDITDFGKIDLRIAEVIAAERIEGTDKLLKLQVSLGEEKRQLVAGIAQHYAPEELIGKQVVVVANLKPAKLRGVESQGMLLAASDATSLAILSPVKGVSPGTRVK